MQSATNPPALVTSHAKHPGKVFWFFFSKKNVFLHYPLKWRTLMPTSASATIARWHCAGSASRHIKQTPPRTASAPNSASANCASGSASRAS